MMKEMKKTRCKALTAILLFCGSLLSFGQQNSAQKEPSLLCTKSPAFP